MPKLASFCPCTRRTERDDQTSDHEATTRTTQSLSETPRNLQESSTSSPPERPSTKIVANIRYPAGTSDKPANPPTELANTGIYYWDDRVLGQGSTAFVYAGFYLTETCKAAVKRVNSERVKIAEHELNVWTNVGVKKENSNVNIVQLFHWVKWPEGPIGQDVWYYICMELATCDLSKRVKEYENAVARPGNPEPVEKIRGRIIQFIHDAAKGLEYLHDHKWIHRDIRPQNILIFKHANSNLEIAKIADFGVTKKLSTHCTGTMTKARGTAEWWPPEAIAFDSVGIEYKTTRAVDIFSLGLTACYALSLDTDRFFDLVQASVPPLKLKSTPSAYHLFEWMTESGIEDRPSVKQVLKHPLFWDWKESLDFLFNVATWLDDKKVQETQEMRFNINHEFFQRYSLVSREIFDWKVKLGDEMTILLMQRKSTEANDQAAGKGKRFLKSYKRNSVLDLVELIRDKKVHFKDLKAELLEPRYFGNDEKAFCENKFINFFLTAFPDITVVLYCILFKDYDSLSENLKKFYVVASLDENGCLKQEKSGVPLCPKRVTF